MTALERRPNYVELLGPPNLLPGESKESYEALFKELETARDPRTLFDYLRVKELTDALWENRRLGRLNAAIIRREMVAAVADRLRKILPRRVGDQVSGMPLAAHYFQDTKRGRALRRLLAYHQVTPDTIMASAIARGFVNGANPLSSLLTNSRTRLTHVLRDDERRENRRLLIEAKAIRSDSSRMRTIEAPAQLRGQEDANHDNG